MIGCFALLIALYIGDREGAFDKFHFLQGMRHYLKPGHIIGAHAAITLAGTIVGLHFMKSSPTQTHRKRIIWILAFAAGLFVAGFLLRPLYGVSKNFNGGCTPTWTLYSCALCCVVYAFLYCLIDVYGLKNWPNFIKSVGQNPLLLYFISFIIHPLLWILGIHHLNNYFDSGIVGVIRTIILTIIFALFSGWLTTRFRIILRL